MILRRSLLATPSEPEFDRPEITCEPYQAWIGRHLPHPEAAMETHPIYPPSCSTSAFAVSALGPAGASSKYFFRCRTESSIWFKPRRVSPSW